MEFRGVLFRSRFTTQSPVPESMTSSRTLPGLTHIRMVNTPPGRPLGEWRIAFVAYSHPTSTTSSAAGESATALAITVRTVERAAGIPRKVREISGGPDNSAQAERISRSVCAMGLAVTKHNEDLEYISISF